MATAAKFTPDFGAKVVTATKLVLATPIDQRGRRRRPVATPGDSLPPPGLPRQVLQLDDNKNAVWDWVQTP